MTIDGLDPVRDPRRRVRGWCGSSEGLAHEDWSRSTPPAEVVLDNISGEEEKDLDWTVDGTMALADWLRSVADFPDAPGKQPAR